VSVRCAGVASRQRKGLGIIGILSLLPQSEHLRGDYSSWDWVMQWWKNNIVKVLGGIGAIFTGLIVVVVGFIIEDRYLRECTDSSEFFTLVTRPDRKEIDSGREFEEQWLLHNPNDEKICTWTKEYKAVFIEGHNLARDSQSSVSILEETAPGEYALVSIPMKAPQRPGEYKSTWTLQNKKGQTFGAPFAVTTIVRATPSTPVPTTTPTPRPTPTPTQIPAVTATSVLPTPTQIAIPTVPPPSALIGSGVKIEQQMGGDGLRVVVLGPDGLGWGGTYVEVYEQKAGGNPARGKRMRGGFIQPWKEGEVYRDFKLNDGTYGVCVRDWDIPKGYSWTTHDCVYNVQVQSGKLTILQLQVGQIEVEILGADGRIWYDVLFEIFLQEQDAAGNPILSQWVRHYYTKDKIYEKAWLTPGLYALVIDLPGYNWGNLREAKGKGNIAVEKGKTTKISIKMGHLILHLTTPRGEASGEHVQVYTLDRAINNQPVLGNLVWDGHANVGGLVNLDLTQGQYALKIRDDIHYVDIEWGEVTSEELQIP
jgi:Ig-like domain from next to BRCA1 gene